MNKKEMFVDLEPINNELKNDFRTGVGGSEGSDQGKMYFLNLFDRTFHNDPKLIQKFDNKKCCLVSKTFTNEGIGNGIFKYEYKPFEGNQCNYDKHVLDNNQQLFIEGKNGWSNDQCKASNEPSIGSCRRASFECIDFVSKKDCDSYGDGLEWRPYTCQQPLNKKVTFPAYDINQIFPEEKLVN